MRRRSGVTLLEVLVAIFVMGIGLLALLTLFPLGALRMAQAIQQQKCVEAGYNAGGIGSMKSVAQDLSLFNPADGFQNPGGAVGAAPAHPYYPSYPVLVDPIGWRAAINGQTNVAGGLSYIARRSVSFVDNPAAGQTSTMASYQWFTDLNDIDYENGLPGAALSMPGSPRVLVQNANGNTISREIRYSWAYLLQRPRYGDSSVVDGAVVVYYKRSVAPTVNTSLPEYSYPNSSVFDTGRNVIAINYAGNIPPPVRVGDWVMDNTYYTFQVPGDANTYGSAHGYFYRAVGVNDLGNNVLEIEVETPLRGFAPNTQVTGTAVVLDGVAEVYTKGVSR